MGSVSVSYVNCDHIDSVRARAIAIVNSPILTHLSDIFCSQFGIGETLLAVPKPTKTEQSGEFNSKE